MNPTMRNAVRWLLAIAVAFLCGAGAALTDGGHPTTQDFIRHGLIVCLPTLMALKATLEKQLGIDGGGVTAPSSGQKGAALWVDVCILLCFVALACGILFSPLIHKHLREAEHARQVHTVQTSGR